MPDKPTVQPPTAKPPVAPDAAAQPAEGKLDAAPAANVLAAKHPVTPVAGAQKPADRPTTPDRMMPVPTSPGILRVISKNLLEGLPPVGGLDFLAMLDLIIVERSAADPVEAALDTDDSSKSVYVVKNVGGQVVYNATDSSGFEIIFTGTLADQSTQEVFRMKYNTITCGFCCGSESQNIEVGRSSGPAVARVVQLSGFPYPKFRVEDDKDIIFIIQSRSVAFPPGADLDFLVLDKEGKNEMGKILKRKSGGGKFTTQSVFGKGLSPKEKLSLLTACFLIHMIYLKGK